MLQVYECVNSKYETRFWWILCLCPKATFKNCQWSIKYNRVSGRVLFTRFPMSQHLMWCERTSVSHASMSQAKDIIALPGCGDLGTKRTFSVPSLSTYCPRLKILSNLVLRVLLSFQGYEIRVYNLTISNVFPDPERSGVRKKRSIFRKLIETWLSSPFTSMRRCRWDSVSSELIHVFTIFTHQTRSVYLEDPGALYSIESNGGSPTWGQAANQA